MSATDVQIRFAAEFALFLVALGGFGFAFLRKDLLVVRPAARAASAAGFATLAAAALCSGALLVDDPSSPVVVTLRLAGVILLSLASASWQPDVGGRDLLRIGLVALIVAEVGLYDDEASVLADTARGVGALAIGACLITASARSIAARVAASGASILFVTITVVAVSMSTIVNDNITEEAVQGNGGLARSEATAIQDEGEQLLVSARVLATALSSTGDAALEDALATVTDPQQPQEQTADERTLVAGRLAQFVALGGDPLRGPSLVVGRAGPPSVVEPVDTPQATWTELGVSNAVRIAVSTGGEGQSVVKAGGDLFALATAPVGELGAPSYRGVVVVTRRIDGGYLARRSAVLQGEEPGVGAALADTARVLGSAGAAVPPEVALRLAEDASRGQDDLQRVMDDRFVVAHAITDDAGNPLGVFVLSTPRLQEDEAREDLFRVLFLIAMGAATAALVLAGLAGDRIAAGLRRLTDAATAIDAGDLDARARITTDDELGALGAAFDRMAHSLGTMTTDLRQAVSDEGELRGRLEAVVAGMGEALVAVDADGVITDFNAAAEALFDLRSSEARSRLVTSIVRLRSDAGTDLSRRLGRPVLKSWGDTGMVRLRDGRDIPVAVSAGALRGPDNEVTGAVFVLRDLRRERELERMRAEFLANISHELRTPLTPIKGFASLLRSRRVTPAKAREFAGEIDTAADDLERVIGQLVNFATVADGQLALDTKPVAVRSLVDEVLRGWRGRVDGTHRFVRRVPADVPRLQADPKLLAQLLDELVDNAVKYSPDGGTIVVGARVLDEETPAIELSVSDEGIGIRVDQVEEILGEFTQGDASTTRQFGGLGLGLALVNRIARAHGGTLVVESEPNVGSRVAVVLPVDGGARGRS